jgi:hypothetical protein
MGVIMKKQMLLSMFVIVTAVPCALHGYTRLQIEEAQGITKSASDPEEDTPGKTGKKGRKEGQTPGKTGKMGKKGRRGETLIAKKSQKTRGWFDWLTGRNK